MYTHHNDLDNNRASSLMVDLAMGYSNEQPTVVRELICESWFFGLQTLDMVDISRSTRVIVSKWGHTSTYWHQKYTLKE